MSRTGYWDTLVLHLGFYGVVVACVSMKELALDARGCSLIEGFGRGCTVVMKARMRGVTRCCLNVAGIARVDIWLANRYRLIAQPITQIGIPSTDVLCVDVSSVFRQCTGWNPALAQQTDEEVQKQMLEHIEFIVGLVKPQKQLFIVVDGEDDYISGTAILFGIL